MKMTHLLRAGDWAQVRALPEILATLDSEGTMDNLPFMPEMVRFCGKTFRVAKRAEKTCVAGLQRRMHNTVHLENLRCDGSAHDGCQVSCLLFWRQEWLIQVVEPRNHRSGLKPENTPPEEFIRKRLATRALTQSDGPIYVCQATALKRASQRLPAWELRQYFREIRAGNVGWAEIRHLLGWLCLWLKWRLFKYTSNIHSTPVSRAETISVGDRVEIKSAREIFDSLTRRGTHRGLLFHAEMLMFCGKRFRVRDNVRRMIEEDKGTMKILQNSCVILDSVTCRGNCTLCPRGNFHFWRSEWLTKVQSQ